MADLHWYNYDKLLSYNGVFNFLVGLRGVGKTYGAKKRAVKDALKNGNEFVYVRRYKEELRMSKDSFFNDLIAENAFPDWDFRINSYTAEAAPADTRDDKKRPWKLIGYFIALSGAQQIKSTSFPLVKTIIFDEFIIEKGATHYLPNEAVIFQGLYSSIARTRENVRVFFLANAVRVTNPYFLYYKIRPDQVGEFSKHHDGFIVCHFADSENFKQDVYRTRFGKFIQGTEYADYAVENQFSDNHDNLLQGKPSDAMYYMSLETAGGIFSVWIVYATHTYYVQEKRPRRESLFTLIPEKMDETRTLLTFTDKMMQNMRTAFRHGRVLFDAPQSRNAFIEVFKR